MNPNTPPKRVLRGAIRVGGAIAKATGLESLVDKQKKKQKAYNDALKMKQQKANNQAELNKGKAMKGVPYQGKPTGKSPYKSGLNG